MVQIHHLHASKDLLSMDLDSTLKNMMKKERLEIVELL